MSAQRPLPPQASKQPSLLLLQDPKADVPPNVVQLTNRPDGFRLLHANSALEGLELLLREPVQAVLLHPPLPDLEATRFCRLVKNHGQLAHIPVVTLVSPQEWQDEHPASSHSPWLMTDVDALVSTSVTADELTRHLQGQIHCYQSLYGLPASSKLTVTAQGPDALPLYLATQASDSLFQLQALESLRELTHQATQPSHFYGLLFNVLEKLTAFHAVGVYLHSPTQEPGLWMFHSPEGVSLSPQQWQFLHQQGKDLLSHHARLQPFDLDGVGFQTFYRYSQEQEGQQVPPDPPQDDMLYQLLVHEEDALYGAVLLWQKPEPAYQPVLSLLKLEQELKHLIHHRYLKTLQQLRAELDTTTQLMSYTALLDLLEREFKRAQRYELPLSLSVFQLANQNPLIAQYGSELIGAVGKLVAYHAHDHFRASDWLARTGPTQFAFLFGETDAHQARTPALRFLERMRDVPLILNGQQIPLQFEVGLSTYEPVVITSGWELMKRALDNLGPVQALQEVALLDDA